MVLQHQVVRFHCHWKLMHVQSWPKHLALLPTYGLSVHPPPLPLPLSPPTQCWVDPSKLIHYSNIVLWERGLRKIEDDFPLDVTSKSCGTVGILSSVHRMFWPGVYVACNISDVRASRSCIMTTFFSNLHVSMPVFKKVIVCRKSCRAELGFFPCVGWLSFENGHVEKMLLCMRLLLCSVCVL